MTTQNASETRSMAEPKKRLPGNATIYSETKRPPAALARQPRG
jgi:hypothetical protein